MYQLNDMFYFVNKCKDLNHKLFKNCNNNSNNNKNNNLHHQIVQRYDLILIQEIRDKSGNAIKNLLAQVNEG